MDRSVLIVKGKDGERDNACHPSETMSIRCTLYSITPLSSEEEPGSVGTSCACGKMAGSDVSELACRPISG